LQIDNRLVWWIVLLLISVVNLITMIIILNDLAKSFGKGVGFTIGLLLLPVIFYPILAFGDAQYVGRAQNNV
jgi:Na+/melibiose symporter-like transporter